jgi:hypothetical protein
MELSSSFQITPSDSERPGAFAAFPYDRELVRRFREAFPRARWRAAEEAWFVPGTTAARRLDTWMSQELETLDRHADARGRDAFIFDPLESPYLSVGEDLRVRTPYSHTIVEAMRAIPWAWWDSAARVWRVPFRSYESLRQRWPEIEEAARRNEPEERKKRRADRKGSETERSAVTQAERRRRRYPVPGDDLPPMDQPVATWPWGVIVFEEVASERIDEDAPKDLYPHMESDPSRYVWARWRMPELWEVYRAKASSNENDQALRLSRGWWLPTRDELQERARKLREMERAQRSRSLARNTEV